MVRATNGGRLTPMRGVRAACVPLQRVPEPEARLPDSFPGTRLGAIFVLLEVSGYKGLGDGKVGLSSAKEGGFQASGCPLRGERS